jgi:hypothetical protein
MRLINADELRKECHTIPDPKGIYCGLDIIEKYEIDDAPTVFDIPDGVTNGEMMLSIFPNIKIITQYSNPFGDMFMLFAINNEDCQVSLDWWNAPYKGK